MNLMLRAMRSVPLAFAMALVSAVLFGTVAVQAAPRYAVEMDLTHNLVFISEYNEEHDIYEATDHIFIASPGSANWQGRSITPEGSFSLRPLTDPAYSSTGEWYRFRSYAACYVNYVTQFQGNFLFHSTPHGAPNYAYVDVYDMKTMGSYASGGCIRLWPRQAAWIWHNTGGSTLTAHYPAWSQERQNIADTLKLEIPDDTSIWPNSKVLPTTTYIYSYPNDTVQSIATLAGITYEQLKSYNPDLDFTALQQSVPVGIAFRIQPTADMLLAELASQSGEHVGDPKLDDPVETAPAQLPHTYMDGWELFVANTHHAQLSGAMQ